MSEERRPTMHVIAGPDGAGKSTLYRDRLEKRLPAVEYVNESESARGKDMAEARRRDLIASRQSFVVETTMADRGKLDLITSAKSAGYEVVLHHVNVRSAQLSVLRSAEQADSRRRTSPDEVVRERYDQSQAVIRDAAKLADRAYVFDNSSLGKPQRLVATLEQGRATRAAENLPAWTREQYADALSSYSPARQHRAATSFADANKLAGNAIGETARTYIPRPKGVYSGPVIGETDLHVVQKLGQDSAVAHFRDQLGRAVKVGEKVEVRYDAQGAAKTRTQTEIESDKEKAAAFQKLTAKEGAQKYPDLAPSYAYLAAVQKRVGASQPEAAARVAERVRSDLAGRIARGDAMPDIRRTDQEQKQDRSR